MWRAGLAGARGSAQKGQVAAQPLPACIELCGCCRDLHARECICQEQQYAITYVMKLAGSHKGCVETALRAQDNL